jgi:hypothetical protein
MFVDGPTEPRRVGAEVPDDDWTEIASGKLGDDSP